MRIWGTVSVVAALACVASCGGSDGSYSMGGDGGGGGGGGGAAGTVTLGPGIQYISGHNGTMNPAVDTIVAGSTVTWTWTGSQPHGVRSVGTPSFTSSPTHTGSGTYVATFSNPGTYAYDCSVHGQAMTGRIVVLPAASPPAGAYDATATADDPTGDTFTPGATWDITGLTLAREPNLVTVMLDFSRDVVPPATGDATALLAFVDLDLDQSTSTGSSAMVDEYRQDGSSTALGVDARINLAAPGDDGTIPITDGLGRETGRVAPIYAGKRVTVHVPTAMLGDDDGYVSAAALVGIAGAPSDLVPQAGHLELLAPKNDDRTQPRGLAASLTPELDR